MGMTSFSVVEETTDLMVDTAMTYSMEGTVMMTSLGGLAMIF